MKYLPCTTITLETGPGPSMTAPFSTRQGVHGPKRTCFLSLCAPLSLSRCPAPGISSVHGSKSMQGLCRTRPQAYPRTAAVRTKSFKDSSKSHLLSMLFLNSFTKLIPRALYLCSAGCRTKLLNTRELESVLI